MPASEETAWTSKEDPALIGSRRPHSGKLYSGNAKPVRALNLIFPATGMAHGDNLGLSFSVTYDFLALGDVNRDKIQDVLFLYKSTNSSNNLTRSCADEGNSYSVYYCGHVTLPGSPSHWGLGGWGLRKPLHHIFFLIE